jgi:hypothetical protein
MYLFMKKGSAFCTIIHSPAMFMALNEPTQHLQGRFIGFIGYLTLTLDPMPILLPTQKTWQWVKEMVAMDGPAIIAFYEEDVLRRGAMCGHQQPSVKEPRAMYHNSYTYHWCCSRSFGGSRAR